MDKKLLLSKLEDLFNIKEVKQGFPSQREAISWANKVAPLLQFNQQYYINFMQNAHKLNLNLSSATIIPAFNIMLSQIEMAIEELKLKIEMEETIPDQMYFPEGSQLDIQKSLARVVRQAQTSLWIFDAYIDEKIIEELSEVPAVEIKVLTSAIKGLFNQRVEAFKMQFSEKSIKIRKSDKSHDRFYILDQEQIWTMGASYNKAGNKATLLSKIGINGEGERIINDFKIWWNDAKEI